MWMNLIVLLFVLGVAYFYSTQGLFSALLHMFLTIIAGTLALVIWEPLTVGFLLERMPEYAWSCGLLAPFALLLIGLRLLTDRLVLGNLDAAYLVNTLAGGAVGFVIGVLTAGMLLIGLQYMGPLSMLGYQPYMVTRGGVERTQSLWIPADTVASNVFGMLSGGAFYPGSTRTVSHNLSGLAQSAAEYRLTSRRIARHAIRPSSVEMLDLYLLDGASAADLIKAPGLALTREHLVVMVGTKIMVQGAAADEDGPFTASAAQVGLLYGVEGSAASGVAHPIGYIQLRDFGSLAKPNDMARSGTGSEEVFHWMFVIPADHTPRSLLLKRLRLSLPAIDYSEAAIKDLRDLLVSVNWNPQPDDGDNNTNTGTIQPAHGLPGGAEGLAITVDPKLPFAVNLNHINTAGGRVNDENELVSARARVERANAAGSRLRVNVLANDQSTAAIVKLQVAPRRARSLLGMATAAATNLHPPLLVDSNGREYRAIGYVRMEGSMLYIDIDPANPVRSLQQTEVQELKDDEQLILYYRVGHRTQITGFRVGQTTVELGLNVP
jgi:hypothetical protein